MELVQGVVVRVSLVKLLAFDRLEHFEDSGFGIGRLLIQDVGHELLFKITSLIMSVHEYSSVTAVFAGGL